MTRRRGRYGADPEDRRLVRVEVRLPQPMYDRLTLARALNGERQTEWVRRKLADAIDYALALALRCCKALRPEGAIYRREGGVYSMIARGSGGERLWLISMVDDMPRSSDPEGIGYRCYVKQSPEGGYDSQCECVYVAAQDMVRETDERARGER